MKTYNVGIVGATGAFVTTISNSTVSVTITTTARASGVLGGETVPSSDANGQTLTGHRIDINNVIVTGSATSTCSKADTGAAGLLGCAQAKQKKNPPIFDRWTFVCILFIHNDQRCENAAVRAKSTVAVILFCGGANAMHTRSIHISWHILEL